MRPLAALERVSLAGACWLVEGVVWLADVLEARRQREAAAPVPCSECQCPAYGASGLCDWCALGPFEWVRPS